MINYIQTPHIPNTPSKKVIIDCRSDKETLKTLEGLGISYVFSKKINCLYEAVSAHPDMQICHLGGNRFVCAKEVYEYYRDELPDADIICGSNSLKQNYPYDVLYNCTRLGNFLIGSFSYTAPEIIDNCSGTEHIKVKQGYSKCSIAIVSQTAIITSDAGICRAMPKDIEVLKIQSGFIELKGMNYGFIGGACGLISQNLLALNGELSTHPDCENIKSFCKNHGVDIIELKKGYINDIGSILPIT